MTPITLESIRQHAESTFPTECCGLISVRNGKEMYTPCKNISAEKDTFIMDPKDYVEVADKSTITSIVHSHCYINAQPSEADKVGCESTNLPWVIYALPTHQVHQFDPSGYVAPLIGREFRHGVLDCYSLIRDYYDRTLGIKIKDYPRDYEWWLNGKNLYLDNFTDAGFKQVDLEDLREHDVILMKMASPTPNHGAVYLGNNVILQHIHGRLSSKDVYGGWYHKATTHVLRHGDLC